MYVQHIFLALTISMTNSVKVFHFSEGDTSAELSTVKMEIPVLEEDQITLCFSHKKKQSNYHTHNMISIFEDRNFLTKNWLIMGLFAQG